MLDKSEIHASARIFSDEKKQGQKKLRAVYKMVDTCAAEFAAMTPYFYSTSDSEDEAVVVCPVDPYVNDDYFEFLKRLWEQASKGGANLTLMGIQPLHPSEKYGYIFK